MNRVESKIEQNILRIYITHFKDGVNSFSRFQVSFLSLLFLSLQVILRPKIWDFDMAQSKKQNIRQLM